MTTDRERLLARHRAELDDWWADESQSPGLGEEQLETARRRNWLSAAREYDESASLAEELLLRLTGGSTATGALSFAVGDALLKPLQETLASVANDDLQLEITGISQGSTVLHVRPAGYSDVHSANMRVDSSPADQAMRELLRLVSAVEDEADVRPWMRALDSMDRLVKALDRFELGVSMTWYARDGETRVSKLTDRGRNYYLGLQETTAAERQTVVSGIVTELRASGVVKVKASNKKNATAWEVRMAAEDLIAMRLQLGQPVHFLVREDETTDKVGRPHSRTWTYLRSLSRTDGLPWDDGDGSLPS
ncbi:hypothetical protein [Kribbella lupini]|uniref:Uncharacterized protein n=1 Tax=Kribbella lupini TaxID=291602 RepID=A0ABP4M1X1_9ACTN